MATELRCADEQQVNTLRQALNTTMVRFDPAREKHYGYAYRRARLLIHQSVYLLTGIYLLVVVPVAILMRSEEMALWRNFGVYPIALALLALWASTRISKPSWCCRHVLALACRLAGPAGRHLSG